MSENSDCTFWLIVVAIIAFAVCRCFSWWCDCQVDKAREQAEAQRQAAYWKTLAEMLGKQLEVQQEIIKMLQR